MKLFLFINSLLVFIALESKSQLVVDGLPAFLVQAKIQTYASGDETIIKKCEAGCKEITYSNGYFRYRDRYFGEYNFCGEEIVWQNDTPKWSMNYIGFTYNSMKIPEEFPHFLKEALQKVDKDYPFRGPRLYSKNEFEYTNSYEGNLKDFNGIERIKFNGKEIYKLYYHGGEIVY